MDDALHALGHRAVLGLVDPGRHGMQRGAQKGVGPSSRAAALHFTSEYMYHGSFSPGCRSGFS